MEDTRVEGAADIYNLMGIDISRTFYPLFDDTASELFGINRINPLDYDFNLVARIW